MKKVCLCLLSALLTSICLTAQTLGTAPNGVFTAADIEYWVGTGSKEAALVLVFNDGKTPRQRIRVSIIRKVLPRERLTVSE